MLIDISYKGEKVDVDIQKMISHCAIPMPVDAKRNMMNASSNFEIIQAILAAVRENRKIKIHCPGAFGEIGGYPVVIDGTGEDIKAYIDESVFDISAMRAKNRESIYLDGIEDVNEGTLTYTDELLMKVKKAFDVDLVKKVPFDKIDEVAAYIISEIIEKNISDSIETKI